MDATGVISHDAITFGNQLHCCQVENRGQGHA
jgi:hypothetical protein